MDEMNALSPSLECLYNITEYKERSKWYSQYSCVLTLPLAPFFNFQHNGDVET